MKLTLEKYQQLEAISKDNSLDDLDKSLFSICSLYGLTEEILDSYKPKQVKKMANKVNKLFIKPFNLNPVNFIFPYRINYRIENITLGQYIELIFFTKHNDVVNKAQYIVATMCKSLINKSHIDKASYLSKCKADLVIGAAAKIKSNFDTFNATKFKTLYENYAEMPTDNSKIAYWFNDNFGWFFSAKEVANFEGITLEQAYSLPVTKALNDLMFLKAKNRYEYYLTTKKD